MASKVSDWTTSERPNLPNKFTMALGKLINQARVAENMSQADLAEAAFLKQSSVSRIEVGTRAVSAEELVYLSEALNKPISYFFPKEFTGELSETELSILEKELLIQARKLNHDDLERVIAQTKALVDLKKK